MSPGGTHGAGQGRGSGSRAARRQDEVGASSHLRREPVSDVLLFCCLSSGVWVTASASVPLSTGSACWEHFLWHLASGGKREVGDSSHRAWPGLRMQRLSADGRTLTVSASTSWASGPPTAEAWSPCTSSQELSWEASGERELAPS